ncbi:MAG TPA: AAA family ATPase [Bacteroidales bacterium]|nr:AAA family ATPase [Bacteroidales bacterium]HRX97753.1 AAA family ATPase [Bacteroidales bacterium]
MEKITVSNYNQIVTDTIVPKKLKTDHATVSSMFDLYEEDKDIRDYIDLYLDKLNKLIATEKKPTPDKPKNSGVKKKRKQLKSQFSKKRSETNSKSNLVNSNPKQVEDIDPAVRFIIRYKNLHGKVKERKHIASFLASLQRAIIKHQIGKDNSYSKEIAHVQKQLIKTLGLMKSEVKIYIKQESLDKYQRIADSEKVRISVAYIKRFIGLVDKPDVKDKAERLLNQIEKALDSNKISEKDKYIDELNTIQKFLRDYIHQNRKKIEIDEFTLNGFQEITGEKKNESPELNEENLGFINVADVVKGAASYVTGRKILESIDQVKKKPTTEEIINSNQLREMEFQLLPFTGVWADIFGKVSQPFYAMVFGMPGSGKSTFDILFAKYLAKDLTLKVLYVASEEGFTYTLREKFDRLNAFSENIDITYKLPSNFKDYDFIFIDSVNELGIDPDQVAKLIAKARQSQISIIFIYRATKDGKYKGLSENEHLVDVSIKVENGVTQNLKNRFGGQGRMGVFEHN